MVDKLKPENREFMSRVRTKILFLDNVSKATALRYAKAVLKVDSAKNNYAKSKAEEQLDDIQGEVLNACHRDPEMWSVARSIASRFFF